MSKPRQMISARPRLDPNDYTVAWLAVLPIEARAALAALDQRHDGDFESDRGDDYIYYGGELNGHQIVVATWPAGQLYGPGSAAALASQVKVRFRNLWFGLLVGVAAGCPDLSAAETGQQRDIRLGDVLLSVPDKQSSGVVQYDLGRDTQEGFFPNGRLNSPPAIVLSAVTSMIQNYRTSFRNGGDMAIHLRTLQESSEGTIFIRPDPSSDLLYDPKTCIPLIRAPRVDGQSVRVWTGCLGSGNSLMRNASHRDRLRDQYNLIGLEMEAAGVMNVLPTMVIRGVCDYGDEHKSKEWQPFAAATAAVYAKTILFGIAPVTRSTRNVHWTILRSKNTYFTGREAVICQIEDVIYAALGAYPPSEQCRIVITGLGGQGKSEICLQVADRMRSRFWGVFWVDVSNRLAAESDILNIAVQLGGRAQRKEDALQLLACTQKPWLLILDNADDTTFDYSTYFPSGSHGVVILTSRNHQCATHATSTGLNLPLDQLTAAEARNLLLKAACVSPSEAQAQEQSIEAAIALLGGHPLAFILAGSFMTRHHCLIEDYLKISLTQRKKVLKFETVQAFSRYGNIFATFEASAVFLQSSDEPASEDALDLLHLVSMCGTRPIPLSLFQKVWHAWQKNQHFQAAHPETVHCHDLEILTSWHADQLPKFLAVHSVEWSDTRLADAIHTLNMCSLISLEKAKEQTWIYAHPLIHAWAKERQTPDAQQQSWLAAACMFAAMVRSKEVLDLHSEWFQSHFQALLDVGIPFMLGNGPPIMITRLVYHFNTLMRLSWRHEWCVELIEDCLTSMKLDPCIPEPDWMHLYTILAKNLSDSGRALEASRLYEQIIITHKRVTPSEWKSIAHAQIRLAYSYLQNNTKTAAEVIVLMHEAIDYRRQHGAPPDKEPSVFASALANAYMADGQHEKAVALLEPLVENMRKISTSHDPGLVKAELLLTEAYQNSEKFAVAVPMAEGIVRMVERMYEVNDPMLYHVKVILAGLYEETNQQEMALSVLEHDDILHYEGERDDYSRLYAEYLLSRYLWTAKRYEEAIHLARRNITARRQILAPSSLELQEGEVLLLFMENQIKDVVDSPAGETTELLFPERVYKTASVKLSKEEALPGHKSESEWDLSQGATSEGKERRKRTRRRRRTRIKDKDISLKEMLKRFVLR